MNKDILAMATTGTKTKDMVIFEINDSGREHEFTARPVYVSSFIGFLESLGFEPKQRHDCLPNVTLEGIEFTIDINNASYMSRNAYSRREAVRKPQNRYVALTKGYDNVVLKVHINVPVDAEKLKAKIKTAIENENALLQQVVEIKKTDEANTIAIGRFFTDRIAKDYISTIHIDKGVIKFHLFAGSIYLAAQDLSLTEISLDSHKSKSIKELTEFVSGYQEQLNGILSTANQLVKACKKDKLPDDLVKWAADAYYRYYDVKTGKILGH